MKTLKQLGLNNYLTCNYADYLHKKIEKINNKDVICCGWMDIHDDGDNINPFFSIEPLYWNRLAIFVYLTDKWHTLSLSDFLKRKEIPDLTYKGNGFSFDARNKHGLVPRKIAERLREENFLRSEEYRTFVNKCDKPNKPKMVWQWND